MGLAVELAGELRNLWPTCVPGFLKDRRDLGIGDEVLPALRVPVEEHPDPALLIGIVKDVRTLGAVLLTLREARGREHTPPAVEILDLRCCQEHLFSSRFAALPLGADGAASLSAGHLPESDERPK